HAGAGAEKAVVREAVRELAALARRAAAGLFPGPVPVCFHGGLAADPAFRAALARELGGRFRPAEPLRDAAAYAAERAARACEVLS
ncbi:MAG: hypothetical protein HY928_15160, partial [Elusimicrobia bacterium]|nr:hypothetical protein [Elusimicrobiota bacterium]